MDICSCDVEITSFRFMTVFYGIDNILQIFLTFNMSDEIFHICLSPT